MKNSLIKTLITSTVVVISLGIIAFFVVTGITLNSQNSDQSQSSFSGENSAKNVQTVSNTNGSNSENASETNNISLQNQISDSEMAENLLFFKEKDITVPDSLTQKEFEGILSSSTLSKKSVASDLARMNNVSPDTVSKELFTVGPGFIEKGGSEGLNIYMPEIKFILEPELIAQDNSLVRIILNSVIDKKGNNILNSDSPFEKNSFFNKPKFEGYVMDDLEKTKYYTATRALRLKGTLISVTEDVKQINGSVAIYLPVDLKKYSLPNSKISPKSITNTGNVTISVIDIKDGALEIGMKGASKTVVYLKLYNASGEVLTTSMSTFIDSDQFNGAGFDEQSTINFNPSQKIDHIDVFVPVSLTSKKYNFSI